MQHSNPQKSSDQPDERHAIVVFISGSGSNLQAILNATGQSGDLQSPVLQHKAYVSLVISNRAKAFGLKRAESASIPTLVFPPFGGGLWKEHCSRSGFISEPSEVEEQSTPQGSKSSSKLPIWQDRNLYDQLLAQVIQNRLKEDALPTPSLFVLAGFMHILTAGFLEYPSWKSVHGQAIPFINLHPALPGAFDGIHAIERAFEAYKQGAITQTGIMVHRVIPEVDRGEVIISQAIPILASDTLESLETRMHEHEHVLLVQAIDKLFSS